MLHDDSVSSKRFDRTNISLRLHCYPLLEAIYEGQNNIITKIVGDFLIFHILN